MTASVWRTLGIPPGSDRETIRRAYARTLRVTNPEDDPEGFMALRAAYEAALRWAAMPAGDVFDDDDDDANDAGGEEPDAQGRRTWWTTFDPAGEPQSREPARLTPGEWQPVSVADPATAVTMDARRLERADFDARRDALLRALTGPWTVDDADLADQLAALAALPILHEIGVRDEFEAWLAHVIASHPPRSDGLVQPAIDTFRWDQDSSFRALSPAVAAVLRRVDEWRFVNDAQRPHSGLSVGWQSLTRPPRADWRMRLSALAVGVPREVQRIIGAADGPLPGIRDWFNREAEAWWRRYLDRPHVTAAMLLLAPLLLALLVWVGRDAGAPDILLYLLAPFAVASPWALAHTLGRWRRAFAATAHPPWLADGWMLALVVLPLLAALLPDTGVGAVAITLAALAVMAWTFVAHEPGSTSGSGLVRLWPIAAVGVATYGLISDHRDIGLTMVIAAFATAWVIGRTPLIGMAWSLLPRFGVPILTAAAVAVMVLPWLGGSGDPPTLVYRSALSMVLATLLLATARAVGGVGWTRYLVGAGWFVAVFVLIVAVGGAMPDRTPAAPRFAVPQDTLIGQPPVPETPMEEWIVFDEYPKGLFTAERAFSIVMDLDVRIDGGVSACRTRTSTGIAAIDDATCAMVARRVTFKPARDRRGLPIAATFSTVYYWKVTLNRPQASGPAWRGPSSPPARSDRAVTGCPPDERPLDAAGPGLSPKACGSINDWISDDDYPEVARRDGMQGRVVAQLVVGSDGRVSGCNIMASSGFPVLDDRTCELLTARPRFLPARDGQGQPVNGLVVQPITWTLNEP